MLLNHSFSKYRLMLSGLLLYAGIMFFGSCQKKRQKTGKLPNIVIILADDLGYGDLGSYNENSLVPTPNLDKLAFEGIRLTDAYCPVSVCSPSRFALMTGNYPFRSWKKSGVMRNYEPSMMADDQLTLPQMLQQAGYTTAGFGKWHLGASFPTLDGKKPAGYNKFKADDNGANIDLGKPISDGPVGHGFEHWFGFSCASECWVMNGREVVAALQHDFYNIESAKNKDHIETIPSDKYLNVLAEKSSRFMEEHIAKSDGEPFFLYFAPYVPHIPLSVGKEFRGATQAGLYGDYIYELDTYIGKLLASLDSLQQSENTIVLFASDNGSQFEVTNIDIDLTKSSNDPQDVLKKKDDQGDHYPNGKLRGTKWTAWEGGVRTPFIARWPGKFPKNSKSDQIFALNDVIATLASIIGFELTDDMALDSYDQTAVLMGKKDTIRKSVLVQSSGSQLGLRTGKWKYIQPKDKADQGELYDLEADISESKNLFSEHPKIVKEIKSQLNAITNSKASNENGSLKF